MLLRGLKWKRCLRFQDDIVVASVTIDENITRLFEAMECIATVGLQMNTKKCRFDAREVKLLGNIESQLRINPDPEKIRDAKVFLQPSIGEKL